MNYTFNYASWNCITAYQILKTPFSRKIGGEDFCLTKSGVKSEPIKISLCNNGVLFVTGISISKLPAKVEKEIGEDLCSLPFRYSILSLQQPCGISEELHLQSPCVPKFSMVTWVRCPLQ